MSLTQFVKAALPTSMKRAIIKLRFDLRSQWFTPYLKKRVVEGEAFDFWIGDPEARDWYDVRCSDPVWLEMRFVRDHVIRPGDVVLDIGAHHGCTAILFSRWVGNAGKVMSFEPMPANCDIIRKNIALNKLTNVTLVHAAVGAEKGVVRIDRASNSAIKTARGGIEVAQTFADAYTDLNPTVLKIDVEGFEYHVLRGATKVLARRPRIVLELHPDHLAQYGSSLEQLLSLLQPLNYAMWLQRDDNEEPMPYDGTAPVTKRAHLFCIPTAALNTPTGVFSGCSPTDCSP